MPTECSPTTMLFAPVERRRVAADFDGGSITSDAGGLLLGATDRAIGLVDRFAACFVDARLAERIEHQWRRWWGSGCLGSRWATRT
jgi:Transposase DDE domain group 1